MQDIAAARALLPWLPAAAAEAMGTTEQSGATANGGAPAGLQRAPTLQRPELGGNLSQFVFVDSPAMVRRTALGACDCALCERLQ